MVAEEARRALETGDRRIVLDGAYERHELRASIYEMAASLSARVVCVFCHCTRPEAIKRIRARGLRSEPRAVDEAIDPAILRSIESTMEYPFADQPPQGSGFHVVDMNTDRGQAWMPPGLAHSRPDFARALAAAARTIGRRRPRVGLDFDGVIANTYLAKREYALKRYDIDLPLPSTRREKASILLGPERYEMMIREIYGSRRTLSLEPMDGAVDAIRRLNGIADCYVITARHRNEFQWALSWLESHRLPVHGASYTSERGKRQAVQALSLDWLVDDSMRNLTGFGDPGPRLALFTPFGDHDEAGEFGGTRTATWKEVVDAILSSL